MTTNNRDKSIDASEAGKIIPKRTGVRFNNLDHLVLFEIMKDNEIWIVKSYVHKMGEEYKMIYGHVESFKKYMCHQSLIDFINSCDYMHGKGEAVTLEKVAALRELNKNDLKKFDLESFNLN